MKSITLFLVLAAVILLGFGCKTIPADVKSTAVEKPNIVLIFSDDLSYHDLSSLICRKLRSIDRRLFVSTIA